jgi:hypothetical protein
VDFSESWHTTDIWYTYGAWLDLDIPLHREAYNMYIDTGDITEEMLSKLPIYNDLSEIPESEEYLEFEEKWQIHM